VHESNSWRKTAIKANSEQQCAELLGFYAGSGAGKTNYEAPISTVPTLIESTSLKEPKLKHVLSHDFERIFPV
jgi:hypothetical protein